MRILFSLLFFRRKKKPQKKSLSLKFMQFRGKYSRVTRHCSINDGWSLKKGNFVDPDPVFCKEKYTLHKRHQGPLLSGCFFT